MIEYSPNCNNFEEKNHLMVHDSNYFWGFPQINEDEFDKEKKIIAGNLQLEQKQNVDVKKFSDMISLKSINLKIK